MKFSCSKVFANYRLFIIFGCSLVFVIQLGYLIPEYIEPTKLNRNTEIINLADLEEFPLVFKFYIRPGLNMTELNKISQHQAKEALNEHDYWAGKLIKLSHIQMLKARIK